MAHMIKIICVCVALTAISGCREKSVFEKRYVCIEIPGYAQKDYVHLLDSPDPELRYIAVANCVDKNVFAAEKLPEAAALPQKIHRLLTDKAAQVRAIAAFSVPKISAGEFEQALVELTDDSESAVRLDAVLALGSKYPESPKALNAIVKRLDDLSILVRLQAIESLTGCQQSKMRPEIAARLLDRLPRAALVEKLKIIQTLGVIGERPKVEPVLLKMLNSKEDAMITTAIEALGRQKSTAAVKGFSGLIGRSTQSDKALVDALGLVGSPEAVDLLVQLWDSGNRETRIGAVQALGKIPADTMRSKLVEQYSKEEALINKELDRAKWEQSSSYDVLMAVVDIIKQKSLKGRKDSGDFSLLKLLNSAQACDNAVGLMLLTEGEPFDRIVIEPGKDSPRLFEALERLRRGPSPFVRLLCLGVMGNTTDPRALPVLDEETRNPIHAFSYAAVTALGKYANNVSNYAPLRRLYEGRERFVPTTYEEDDKNYVMRQCIETVVSNAENKYVTRQRRVGELASPSPSIRLIAAVALAKNEDSAAIPVLLDFARKGTPGEQRAALDGLETMSDIPAEGLSKLQGVKEGLQDAKGKEKIDRIRAKQKR